MFEPAEATILMFLRHPHLVAVHNMGTDETLGVHYAVMDLAPVGTLTDRRKQLGSLPIPQIAAMGLPLCCVLDMLHQRRIVHRDVKPSNLLCSGDGRVLLANLGISKLPDAILESDDDRVIGSFPFMAPEQLTGMDLVGPSGDLYAVGATLFNLATGHSSAHLFAVHEGSVRWQKLPEALRPIVRHCCQLKPVQRPSSTWHAARELAPLVDPELLTRPPHIASWLEFSEGRCEN